MSTINVINNGGVITTVFSTPGTTSWTKNSRTRIVNVQIWSGGGGGGSGRKGTANSSGGGGGGGGGNFMSAIFPAIYFNSTETVVVGSGGAGGNAQSTDATNGNPGLNTNTGSSFSNIKVSLPVVGSAGIAGTSAAQTQSPTLNFLGLTAPPGLFPTSGASGQGGNGTTTTGTNGNNNVDPEGPTTPWFIPTGGGGGGGAQAAADGLGGSGGAIYSDASVLVVAGGIGGTNTQGGNGQPGIYGSTGNGLWAGSGAAGGGYAFGTTTASAGGTGGQPGGGGGGGSGGVSAVSSSGAGGQGGAGLVIVTEYF